MKIEYQGFRDDKEWPHFAWRVTIGQEAFIYKTGTGHQTSYFNAPPRAAMPSAFPRNAKPKDIDVIPIASLNAWVHVPNADEVLACLFDDAQAGSESFDDFCSNLGYDNDSLKALDTYRACMDTAQRLRRALGDKYTTERNRIDALREEGKI